MVRLHLAQVFHNVSYYDPSINYLEEPYCFSLEDKPLGKIRTLEGIENLLAGFRNQYISHYQKKIIDIINWCSKRESHVIVFPEYSIPYQLLPEIRKLAVEKSILIVAGTHKIIKSSESEVFYNESGLAINNSLNGCACSPIFFPNGLVQIVTKQQKSKFEPNLRTFPEDPKVFHTNYRDIDIKFSVIPCVDSLHPNIIGNVMKTSGEAPQIIICPSFSPITEPFSTIGSITSLNEILFLYVNTSFYGGTFYNIPSNWEPYVTGYKTSYSKLGSDIEAVLELDADVDNFFNKKGSIISKPICNHPVCFPIVYRSEASWFDKYSELSNDVIEWVSGSGLDEACEIMDSYLTDEASNLPRIVAQRLNEIRHSLIPFYDGNIESVKNALDLVEVSEGIEDTKKVWAKLVQEAIVKLTSFLIDCDDDYTNSIMNCLRGLKKRKKELPPVDKESGKEPITVDEYISVIDPGFIGEDNLVDKFQDRGPDLDSLIDIFSNHNNKVVFLIGSLGIGKSSFINWMFKKQFVDWQPIRVSIPPDSHFSRVLSDIAYKLGISLDTDSLAYSKRKIFRNKVIKVIDAFYSNPKRVLIIDDLYELFKNKASSDYDLLKVFIEEASNPKHFIGGRIVFVSSKWVPETLTDKKGVVSHRLKGIPDRYVKRIIEFHMKTLKLIENESGPRITQDILDLVQGHPLTAKLLVEAMQEKLLNNDYESMIEVLSTRVANELLDKISLNDDDAEILKTISVFRLPVLLNYLLVSNGFEYSKEQIMYLADGCILYFDGNYLYMHEAVRRYFYNSINKNMLRENYHKIAINYYQNLYNKTEYNVKKDPNIVAELAHHLSLSGNISRLRALKKIVVSEIKPTARMIYREYKEYDKALELFRIVSEIMPDDPGVFAYIGRCYARKRFWTDSDSAFERAIAIAKKNGTETWWIYRDWGHIRSRYGFTNDALFYFDLASSERPDDPSIIANKAYMYWRQHEDEEAKHFFEAALALDPDHEYTLTYYSRFLKATGNHEYAKKLQERLDKVDAYYEPSEYEFDYEYADD